MYFRKNKKYLVLAETAIGKAQFTGDFNVVNMLMFYPFDMFISVYGKSPGFKTQFLIHNKVKYYSVGGIQPCFASECSDITE
jgi:hypothetical protein